VGDGRGVSVFVGVNEGVGVDTGVLVEGGKVVLVDFTDNGGEITGMVGVGCCFPGAAQLERTIRRRSERMNFCICILTIHLWIYYRILYSTQ
jgi:hypothetical protein